MIRKSIIACVLTGAVLGSSAAYARGDVVAGVGIGVPYGGIGVSANMEVNQYISLTGGVGTTTKDLGWAVGARANMEGRNIARESALMPYLALYYGTVTMIETGAGDEESVDGPAYGFGLEWVATPRYIINFEVLFADADIPAGYRETGSAYKLSLGVGMRF